MPRAEPSPERSRRRGACYVAAMIRPAAVAFTLLLMACGAAPGPAASTTPAVRDAAQPHAARTHHAHAGHPHDGHAHGDRMPHDELSAEAYAARLEPADRDAWQQPAALIAALGIREGAHVADVGAGSGYFVPHLARAVGASGRVVAEDLRDDLLALVRARATREGLAQVETRVGAADDPRLEPGAYDLILFVDTYHHVADRPTFLGHLARALTPRGRLVIVDFREGTLPVGPPPAHKIPRAVVETEVRAAGFTVARTHDFLPHQWVLELIHAACQSGTPGCDVRAERPRVVLDASLTPTEAGLPAISADGVEVAVALTDPDPERASSSLSIRFLATADGATRRELPVLDVREALALEDDDPDAATRARIERRVAELDEAFSRGGFTPLRNAAISRDGSIQPTNPDELALAFDTATRTLTARGAEGRERLRTTLAPATRRCGGREVSQPATPVSAWAEAARGLLLVRVTFASAPRCAAAAPEERVFRLE